jgi:putative oxidoreductase
VNIFIAIFARCLLVLIFLPFSALDKLLNFKEAVHQASEVIVSAKLARTLIVVGFLIEVVMSIAILTGVADRLAAFIMAGYCVITALLWKQFWKLPDFRLRGNSSARDTFWDFLKNLALAGGFLLLTFGPDASGVHQFFSQSRRFLTSVCSVRSGRGITLSETPTVLLIPLVAVE